MSVDESTCDCVFFDYGDAVQHKLNPDVWGIVIGDADFGRRYTVRLAPTLTVVEFHGVELELLGDEPSEKPSEDSETNFTESNVIPFERRKAAGEA